MATITVLDATDDAPLWLAHVYKFSTGQGAVTDMDGNATIPDDDVVGQWAISHVGFTSANLNITEPSSAVVRLTRGVELGEVEIFPPDYQYGGNDNTNDDNTEETKPFPFWILGLLLIPFILNSKK